MENFRNVNGVHKQANQSLAKLFAIYVHFLNHLFNKYGIIQTKVFSIHVIDSNPSCFDNYRGIPIAMLGVNLIHEQVFSLLVGPL